MIRGLYTSATGMTSQLLSQEVIANNLANVDTIGYKKDIPVKSSFSSLLISRLEEGGLGERATLLGRLGTSVALNVAYTDFSGGALKFTENNLDLAIKGEGFFVIQTPDGERYSREGSFAVNSKAELVTKDGFSVMGKQGPIKVSEGLHFSEDGSVIINGQLTDQLKVVMPTKIEAFQKTGNNLFSLREGFSVSDASDFCILEGYLESSNVNVVKEMVDMISGFRLYEASQKSIQFQDETLERLINELSRV